MLVGLLYEGSFVAERVASIQSWYDAHPAPTTKSDGQNEEEKDVLLPRNPSHLRPRSVQFFGL